MTSVGVDVLVHACVCLFVNVYLCLWVFLWMCACVCVCVCVFVFGSFCVSKVLWVCVNSFAGIALVFSADQNII